MNQKIATCDTFSIDVEAVQQSKEEIAASNIE
ncbi:transcriptional regulator, partial [Staphylococcus pseudintermedius]